MHPVAILTNDPLWAERYLQGRMAEYKRGAHKGTLTDGRNFVIVTNDEQLRGLEISSYETAGAVKLGLLQLAQTRVR